MPLLHSECPLRPLSLLLSLDMNIRLAFWLLVVPLTLLLALLPTFSVTLTLDCCNILLCYDLILLFPARVRLPKFPSLLERNTLISVQLRLVTIHHQHIQFSSLFISWWNTLQLLHCIYSSSQLKSVGHEAGEMSKHAWCNYTKVIVRSETTRSKSSIVAGPESWVYCPYIDESR